MRNFCGKLRLAWFLLTLIFFLLHFWLRKMTEHFLFARDLKFTQIFTYCNSNLMQNGNFLFFLSISIWYVSFSCLYKVTFSSSFEWELFLVLWHFFVILTFCQNRKRGFRFFWITVFCQKSILTGNSSRKPNWSKYEFS